MGQGAGLQRTKVVEDEEERERCVDGGCMGLGHRTHRPQVLYEVGPQLPWALGPSLAIQYMTPSPFRTFSLNPNASRPSLGPRVEMRLHRPRYPGKAPLDRLELGRRCYCSGTLCTWLIGSAFRNIIAEWAFGGGNQFRCYYHLSQRNIHLEMMELDPHSH